MEIFGIDIGGSGIKGAPVNIENGEMLTERFRLPTPEGGLPSDIAVVVGEVARHFNWNGPIGCAFPAIVKHGITLSAANVDQSWIGTNGAQLFSGATGCPVRLINDADAAGLAEMRFGAGRDQQGVVMLLTFGTGIGSALFFNGVLVPNTELGHMEVRGKEAEDRASARVREEQDISWKKWASRVDEYMLRLEALLSPDLFIVGGGISRQHARFLPLLTLRTPVVVAAQFNDAGIIGAALAAADAQLV